MAIEINRMWKMKTKTIPIVIGTTGIVSKNITKYLDQIPGEHRLDELQKTALIGTAHILRKVLE